MHWGLALASGMHLQQWDLLGDKVSAFFSIAPDCEATLCTGLYSNSLTVHFNLSI